MAMKGFDPRWKDLPDYILGITQDIWENRQIDTLNHLYSEDIVVRSPGSVVVGNQGVIAATMATLAEFPDRQLLGEDVIWSGDDHVGYLSSHRILSKATHLHDGLYGEASGKTYTYRVIADCAAKDNVIHDEWLVRDQGSIVRQMGLEPKAFAVDLIEREGGPEHCVKPLTPETDLSGSYDGRGNDHAFGQQYASLLENIMASAMSSIPEFYDRACHLELPGGVTAHGIDAADQFWMGLRASFPTAEFKIDHVIGREDPSCPPRAAIRWSLYGKHEGWGLFGEPSQADVYVLGINHAEFGPQGLRREFVLLDETAVWKQIALKTG